MPPGEVDRAAHCPLHQDVARVILVLTETGQGVVFATAELDTIAIVDVAEHPHRAAGHHLQSAKLLPEKSIQ